VGRGEADGAAGLDLAKGDGFRGFLFAAWAGGRPRAALFFGRRFFLDELLLVRVPLAAMGAFAQPLGGGSAAVGAEEDGAWFCHEILCHRPNYMNPHTRNSGTPHVVD